MDCDSVEPNIDVPSSEMGVMGPSVERCGVGVLRTSGVDTARCFTSAIGMRFCGAPGGSSTETGNEMELLRRRACFIESAEVE